MRLFNVDEPELEFGGAQPYIDIRFGLKDYGPLDLLSTQSPKVIHVGLVGTSDGLTLIDERVRPFTVDQA